MYGNRSAFLDEAADQIRKAAKLVEEMYDSEIREATGYSSLKRSANDRLVDSRERIAKAFATLAAIEQGLIPAELIGDMINAAVSAATSSKATE